MLDLIEEFEQALLSIDRLTIRNMLLQSGDPIQAIDTLIVPVLDRIGQGWEQGTVSLSQVYMSGRICEELVNSLLPEDRRKYEKQPQMAITVLDDYHVLGKRIVYSMLRSVGFECLDYGQMTADALIQRAQDDEIEILLISSLMLRSALHIADVTLALSNNNVPTKILVGGAPFRFDTTLWREVGADGVGRNAADALSLVTNLVEGGQS